MIELALNKIEKYYGATKVLENISFEVMTGDRVGIVGDNGCGKTTIFNIIMGLEAYESGSLALRKDASLGYLEQVPDYTEGYTGMDVLKEAFKAVDILESSMKNLENKLESASEDEVERLLSQYSELQLRFEGVGGYEKEEKLSRVCTGLNLSCEFLEQDFASLSGGEKTTINLGRILLENPNILLLDEPSNHLDFEAMEWLEDYLRQYRGTVLVISHDRYFLDRVTTRIVEIENMVSACFQGNYSAYVEEKDRQLQLQLEDYENQQKKIKAIEKSIAQLKDWGNRGDNGKFFRRAFSMQKMLERMDRIDKPLLDKRSISINANLGDRSGNQVIKIEALRKSYGNRVIIDNADLLIRQGEAVSLIGANGCGKSTLIKLLLGVEDKDGGKAELGSSVELAYLPQEVMFNDEKATVLEAFREDIAITEGKAREYLAGYMFFGEDVFKKVSGLSGGERSRLKLAIMMYNPANLLILDEPTNHLDIASREELEELLRDFKGTVLFVSHDRTFINNIATRVVELKDGLLISYDGNYEYYKEKCHELKLQKVEKSCHIKNSNSTSLKDVEDNKAISTSSSANNPWKKERLEGEIEELEYEIKSIEGKLEGLSDDYEGVNVLYQDKVNLEKKLENKMEEYYKIW